MYPQNSYLCIFLTGSRRLQARQPDLPSYRVRRRFRSRHASSFVADFLSPGFQKSSHRNPRLGALHSGLSSRRSREPSPSLLSLTCCRPSKPYVFVLPFSPLSLSLPKRNLSLTPRITSVPFSLSVSVGLLIPLGSKSVTDSLGLPSKDQLLTEWRRGIIQGGGTAQELEKAMLWVEVWMLWRLGIIAQGIAARVQRGRSYASGSFLSLFASEPGLISRLRLFVLPQVKPRALRRK